MEQTHQGKLLEVTLPSGNTITLREQNGDDEDILSNNLGRNDGGTLLRYLQAVIVGFNGETKKLLVSDISDWGIKDKYYALFKSRIHTFGNLLKFDYACPVTKPKVCGYKTSDGALMVEDLSIFDGNLADTQYTAEGRNFAVTPYKHGAEKVINCVLSSGRIIKYNVLNTSGENYILDLPENLKARGQALIARKLAQKKGDVWLEVKNFSEFSANEMREIWDSVNKCDMNFIPLSEVTCPLCGNKDFVPIMTDPSFFFPTEI